MGLKVKKFLTNLDSPRNLILDTKKNLLGRKTIYKGLAILKKSNIDGTNIQTVINTNSEDSPQGFQIDFG